jgi:signal peptidase II
MNNKVSRVLLIVLIISFNIACDQSTKHYAKETLKGKGTIQVVGDFFVLRYAENNGAFLGIFASFPKAFRIVLLCLVPCAAICLVIVWLVSKKHVPFLPFFFLCCFIGGGMSNLIDRLVNNEYVADFMNLGIGRVIRSGIFNFADLSIMFGAIGVFIYYLSRKKDASSSSVQ